MEPTTTTGRQPTRTQRENSNPRIHRTNRIQHFPRYSRFQPWNPGKNTLASLGIRLYIGFFEINESLNDNITSKEALIIVRDLYERYGDKIEYLITGESIKRPIILLSDIIQCFIEEYFKELSLNDDVFEFSPINIGLIDGKYCINALYPDTDPTIGFFPINYLSYHKDKGKRDFYRKLLYQIYNTFHPGVITDDYEIECLLPVLDEPDNEEIQEEAKRIQKADEKFKVFTKKEYNSFDYKIPYCFNLYERELLSDILKYLKDYQDIKHPDVKSLFEFKDESIVGDLVFGQMNAIDAINLVDYYSDDENETSIICDLTTDEFNMLVQADMLIPRHSIGEYESLRKAYKINDQFWTSFHELIQRESED